MIYLNAAGHGLPDPTVRARMIAHLQREEEIGPIAAETEAHDEAEAVRSRIAALLNAAGPDEIALPPWTTTGWNAAMLSIPLSGRRVLMAPGQWSSDVALAQRLGANVEIIPTHPDGRIDLEGLAAVIDEDLVVLACPMVCSLTGERYPVEAIGAMERPASCFFAVDAAQAVGQMPVDVAAIGADILTAPVRKWLRGPRGTGLLYVRQSALARMEPSLVAHYGSFAFDGQDFADEPRAARFEPTGYFMTQRLGVSAALDVLERSEAEETFAKIRKLSDHVRTQATFAGLTLSGAETTDTGIVTLRMPTNDLAQIMERLNAAEIVAKPAAPDCEPLRRPETIIGGFLRISPHVYNTAEEIDRAFEVITG